MKRTRFRLCIHRNGKILKCLAGTTPAAYPDTVPCQSILQDSEKEIAVGDSQPEQISSVEGSGPF